MSPTRPSAVVILAAGQGTRMRSALPKVLHEICGRTLLGHAIAAAAGLEPEHIVVVVRHQRDLVATHALSCDPRVIIADQDEIPGTGRALWCGLEQLPDDLEGSIVVMAGDTPLLDSPTLAAMHEALDDCAVSVLTTELEDATGYGRIIRDRDGVICGVVEHKDASEEQRAIKEVNTSTYAFDLAFLRRALGGLGTSNAQGEMYLTDVVASAYEQGAGVSGLLLEDSTLVEGCNDLVQLAALRREMNRRINEKWMRQGVTILDPATTWIDVQARLEADSRIYPGTSISGESYVGARAQVGPGEYSNVIIGEDADVRHCVLHGGEIRQGECLKPFTVLPVGGDTTGGLAR